MNARKLEPWAQSLLEMPTGDMRSIKESFDKAITPEETLHEIEKRSKSAAALVSLAEGPGIPFTRYEKDKFKRRDFHNWRNKKATDVNNPISNKERLPC